jgi:hypothetical protein
MKNTENTQKYVENIFIPLLASDTSLQQGASVGIEQKEESQCPNGIFSVSK